MKLPAIKANILGRVEKLLMTASYYLNHYVLFFGRLTFASSRGALNVATRRLDPSKPISWEFSAFSQNGEDGIIDHLMSLIPEPNRYFIEIGAAEGLENNSSYLAFVKKYSGLMVEGDALKTRYARRFLQPLNLGVRFCNIFVTPETTRFLTEQALHQDPDFFSLDIDGMDYYVAQSLLEGGLRPKVVCVEYNSAYGPDQSLTIPFQSEFNCATAHESRLYYGVSLAGWQSFFGSQGYEFVTVESNGVNAFFIDPLAIDPRFLKGLERLEWRENGGQITRFSREWNGQFELIDDMPFVTI